MAESPPETPDAPASDVLDTAEAGPAAIRGGAISAGGYALSVGLSVGSSALLFRYLGVVDAGRYVTVVTLIAIVNGLTNAGLTNLGVREMSTRRGAERARMMRNLLGIRIVLTSAGVGLAVGYAAVAGFSEALVLGTFFAGVGLLASNIQATLGAQLQSRLRFGVLTAVTTGSHVLMFAMVIALVLAEASLVAILAAPVPAMSLGLIVTALLARGAVPVWPALDRDVWRPLMREALPYALAAAVVAVYFRLGVLVVEAVADPRETGYFGISFRIVDVLVMVPQLVVGAAFPIFARAAATDRTRLVYAFQRVMDVGVALGVGVALALTLGAPIAIAVIAGADAAPAADVLRIQGWALALSFAVTASGYVLLSLKMYRALLIVSSAALVVTLAALLVLTPIAGAEGAAVATVIGEFTVLALNLVALIRTHPDILPSPRLLPRILAAAVAALAVALAVSAPVVVTTAAGLLVYGSVLVALKALPAEVLDAIPRRTLPLQAP